MLLSPQHTPHMTEYWPAVTCLPHSLPGSLGSRSLDCLRDKTGMKVLVSWAASAIRTLPTCQTPPFATAQVGCRISLQKL